MSLQNLQDKLSGSLERVDARTRYMIFAGILLFVFFLDYFFLMRPQLNTLNKIGPEIQLLRDDLVRAKSDIQRIDDYKSQVSKLESNLTSVNTRVRLKDEVPLILEKISRIANRNNIKIDQIVPQTADMRKVMENNQKIFFALPIYMEAQSGYHSFGKFLNELERDQVLLKTESLNISSSNGSKEHFVRLTVEAILYEENK